MLVTVRSVRDVSLVGYPKQKINTDKDARVLANFLMQNIPSSTFRRMTEIFEEYNASPISNWKEFMASLPKEDEE